MAGKSLHSDDLGLSLSLYVLYLKDKGKFLELLDSKLSPLQASSQTLHLLRQGWPLYPGVIYSAILMRVSPTSGPWIAL